MPKKTDELPDELNYTTSVEANVMIVRAMSEIAFMRRMEKLMPLVAKELERRGVDFSKARVESDG